MDLHQAIISALPAHFNHLLDMQCGDGELISNIAERSSARFTGVAGSRENVSAARGRGIPNSEFFVQGFHSLNYYDECFDVVISPDAIGYFREVWRVLADEGMFIMADHSDEYASDRAVSRLKDSGFKNVRKAGGLIHAQKDNNWSGDIYSDWLYAGRPGHA